MNKLLILTTLYIVAAGASAQAIDETVDADPNGAVEIDNDIGDIAVSGWDEARVHVTGELSENAERIDVRREGNRVIVEVVYPPESRNSGFRNYDETDLVISVPRGSSLFIDTVSGDVMVARVDGEQDIRTVSGDVSSRGVGDMARFASTSGDIEITGTDVTGTTRAEAVSGDVLLAQVSGRIDAQSVSGDVELRGTLLESAELQSVSGDLLVSGQLSSDARVRARTTSGDVEVYLQGDGAGQYEISTMSGEIDNCFGPRVRPNSSGFGPSNSTLRFTEGSSGARVDVATLSGDVELCRE
jgi:DUF4097 and DUF4098 domain-containing protein YvlB